MERYFDRWGPAGRAMMRSTASIQVNVESARIGHGPGDLRRRWDVLHAVGPVLSAAFSTGSLPTWADYAGPRQAIWLALDPARCRAPKVLASESLQDAWTRWVLDAPVAMIRRPDRPWTAPAGLTFRQWLREGRAAVPDVPPPDASDLQYHLSTLFPPVRIRGHFEVRYLDAQPGRWWRVPAAVVATILEDDVAQDAAMAACESLAGQWWTAARIGLAEPEVRRAARAVLAAAAESLDRTDSLDRTESFDQVESFDQGDQDDLGDLGLAELTAEYFDRRPSDPTDPSIAQVRPC
jgi:glutamate--cysteine ligase